MRLISFQHTADQIREGTKTVTRRLGWSWLQPGTELLACAKVRGVQREDRQELGIIRVVDVRREPLRRLIDEPSYGAEEIRLEGFAGHPELENPEKWVDWFCQTHSGCATDTLVTRIEFELSYRGDDSP